MSFKPGCDCIFVDVVASSSFSCRKQKASEQNFFPALKSISCLSANEKIY